jgi:hypothetical protein
MPAIASTSGRLHGEFTNYYFYRFIGKLTNFLQFQEFSLSNPPVDYSNSSTRCSRPPWKQKSAVPSRRLQVYVLHSILMGHPSLQEHILTHHTHKHSSINLVSIFRCSSSPSNPVYERRVDFSDLVFSLSSHRHSYLGFVFDSRFLDS